MKSLYTQAKTALSRIIDKNYAVAITVYIILTFVNKLKQIVGNILSSSTKSITALGSHTNAVNPKESV